MLLVLGLPVLNVMSKGMAGATISLPIIFIVAFIAGKVIFSDNVVFRRSIYLATDNEPLSIYSLVVVHSIK